MTATAIHTPFDLSNATKVGKTRWRKQVLPLTTIDYKGRKIDFNKQYLMDLARSFKARAYDQVPFVLANEKNEHHMDPKLFEGECIDFVMAADGLDAVFDLTPEGAEMVRKNPRLGVSARIVEGLAKSDGRIFKRAIQHVLATMDPRVTGLRPWQAVDLSASGDIEVVDLTAETYEGRNTQMPKSKLRVGSVDKETRTATIDLSKLSDEEFESLLDLGTDTLEEVQIDPKTGKPVAVVPVEDDDEDDEVDPDEIEDPDAVEGDDAITAADVVVPGTGQQPPAAGPKKRKTTTTVEEEALDQGGVVANLSNEFAAWKAEQSKATWQAKADKLAHAGVAPFLLDLAAPWMESTDSQVIELSNGKGTPTIKETLEKMLNGFSGMVDLTPEMGHSIDLSDLQTKDDPDQALLDEWEAVYGS
jgi:hypothetical protein